MVECRFKVEEISRTAYAPEAIQVKMCGVKSPPFGDATPSASCQMSIRNSEAAIEFELGEEYRVTFEKIKK